MPQPSVLLRTSALILVLLFAYACGDDSNPEPLAVDPPPSDDDYDPSPKRPSNSACVARLPPPPGNRLRVERAFGHLSVSGTTFRALTSMVEVGAGEWMVSRLGGQVLGFDEERGEVRVLLDIGGELDFSSRENGLVSIAVHPRFADNGWLFAVYSVPSATGGFISRLGRFEMGEEGTFDPASERVLLDVPQRRGTHSMNHVQFGPDGMLFVSIGDDLENYHALGPEHQENLAQNPGSLKGKLLRLDVDNEEEGRPYAIPVDNPWAADGEATGEVYALGLRNPWRFVVEDDGQIVLGDVGQDTREELNLITAGGNYGWPHFEGRLCHTEAECDNEAYTLPLVDYTIGGPKAVVAGPRYTDDAIAGLEGRFLFADYVLGHIWSFALDEQEPRLELEGSFPVTSFARGSDGAVYLLRYDGGDQGGIYELVPNVIGPEEEARAAAFPRLLSTTGCVDPEDPRQVAEGVIPYNPISRLWSDGADKDRFFAIPDDRRISVDAEGALEFPPGSVLIKHFRFGERYHETRFYMRSEEGWQGYSDRWNEEQTDAVLLDTAEAALLPNGVNWSWPSRSQCNLCHTEASGFVLGLETSQLDQGLDPVASERVEEPGDNQLSWLFERDFFTPDLGSVEQLRAAMPPLAAIDDASAPVDQRVRSYLHTNCAMCHRPDGNVGRGNIDLRVATPLPDTGMCEAESETGRVWGYGNWEEQRILRAGRPMDSILYLRVSTPGYFRMPPLASEVLHEDATALLEVWIAELEDCSR